MATLKANSTPKNLFRSLDNEKAWSYFTAYDKTDNSVIACGWGHYYGLPHLNGTITSILANRGNLNDYWHKKVEVEITQNEKIVVTDLRIEGYSY